ncbi:uncharacterized protein LOC111071798 [Drosophila obscura]|uniref:uncharacterized protein LOC111071798 n=1 Tax=Drosophila obscura TaxID=7282 RepID=UPI001BB20899|nr:uncharacterized protein LOC111071798 [Drosophila obscura]
MTVKVLLGLLLLNIATEVAFACTGNLCPEVTNTNHLCSGTLRYQCVCDFTCSEWDQPCNWCLTCPEEISDINTYRNQKNKLPVFGLPNKSYKQCLDINIQTHNYNKCRDIN